MSTIDRKQDSTNWAHSNFDHLKQGVGRRQERPDSLAHFPHAALRYGLDQRLHQQQRDRLSTRGQQARGGVVGSAARCEGLGTGDDLNGRKSVEWTQ
jgi:hypothetical protein